MSARHKLNGAHLTGSLLVAGIVGAVAQSFSVFVVAFVGLLIAGFVAGDIRR